MNPVTFNCNVLRDGHQSLAATRMKTEDMLPIAPILDSMGFSALETWGGATIDAGLRFLKEWPFDRLDAPCLIQHTCAARTSWATPTTRTTWWKPSSP